VLWLAYVTESSRSLGICETADAERHRSLARARAEIATRCVSESRVIAVVRCAYDFIHEAARLLSRSRHRPARAFTFSRPTPGLPLFFPLRFGRRERPTRGTRRLDARARARAVALAGTIVGSERSRRGQKAWII